MKGELFHYNYKCFLYYLGKRMQKTMGDSG